MTQCRAPDVFEVRSTRSDPPCKKPTATIRMQVQLPTNTTRTSSTRAAPPHLTRVEAIAASSPHSGLVVSIVQRTTKTDLLRNRAGRGPTISLCRILQRTPEARICAGGVGIRQGRSACRSAVCPDRGSTTISPCLNRYLSPTRSSSTSSSGFSMPAPCSARHTCSSGRSLGRRCPVIPDSVTGLDLNAAGPPSRSTEMRTHAMSVTVYLVQSSIPAGWSGRVLP
jgi:hypothetical protein